MGAIRGSKKPENGQITFKVPDETIIIEFQPVQDEERASLLDTSRQLFDRLPALNPDLDWNSLHVYEQ